MNRIKKFCLDISIGAIIPILVLNHLNEQLGAILTHIVAAFVSIVWIYIDLIFITRRLNIITSYIGVFAIVRGLLAFYFVDGLQFAIKDSAGYLLTAVVFGISIAIRRPIIYFFLVQALSPDSLNQARSLKDLLREPKVYRSLIDGTKFLLCINLLIGAANFLLNLQIVIAEFGTSEFNQQVAQVNSISQIALAIPEFIGVAIVATSIRRSMFYYLPRKDGMNYSECDFWELLQLRDSQKTTVSL